jgi:glutamate synthase domain-containing protein 3
MHIDIGASKDKKKEKKKKDGYTTNCIKNEAEHITDDMVTKRVTAYIRKNEKDHKDTDIINKNRNIGAALSETPYGISVNFGAEEKALHLLNVIHFYSLFLSNL